MTPVFKRLILITYGIIIGIFNINAQKNEGFELGASLGSSLATVSTSGENNTGSRMTFNVGASSEYYFSDRWGAKVKIISDNKGFSNATIIDENSNDIPTDIDLHYITIPVMANWHFSKRRRWYLSFGPYLGLLTSAKDSELQMDISNQISNFDYGIAFSIGYKFNINDNIKLFIEGDGQSGINNIIAGDNDYSVWNGRSAYNIGMLINL